MHSEALEMRVAEIITTKSIFMHRHGKNEEEKIKGSIVVLCKWKTTSAFLRIPKVVHEASISLVHL